MNGNVLKNTIKKGSLKTIALKGVQYNYLKTSNSKCGTESFYEFFGKLISAKMNCSIVTLQCNPICKNYTSDKYKDFWRIFRKEQRKFQKKSFVKL